MAVDRSPEEHEETLPLPVIAERASADVGVGRDVVETAGELDAVGARHDGDDRARTGEAPPGRANFVTKVFGVRP
jgi:hypothetical protein